MLISQEATDRLGILVFHAPPGSQEEHIMLCQTCRTPSDVWLSFGSTLRAFHAFRRGFSLAL